MKHQSRDRAAWEERINRYADQVKRSVFTCLTGQTDENQIPGQLDPSRVSVDLHTPALVINPQSLVISIG